MQTLYLVSVWIHILAASIWLGGMAFLVLVLVPWLRRTPGAPAGTLLSETGRRFRSVGWVCFALLLVTGSFNLSMRGVTLASLSSAVFWATPFGRILLTKLVAFSLVLGVSAIHDFVLGPRATALIARHPRSREAAASRRHAALLGRVNAILALVLVAAGVMLVRGSPW